MEVLDQVDQVVLVLLVVQVDAVVVEQTALHRWWHKLRESYSGFGAAQLLLLMGQAATHRGNAVGTGDDVVQQRRAAGTDHPLQHRHSLWADDTDQVLAQPLGTTCLFLSGLVHGGRSHDLLGQPLYQLAVVSVGLAVLAPSEGSPEPVGQELGVLAVELDLCLCSGELHLAHLLTGAIGKHELLELCCAARSCPSAEICRSDALGVTLLGDLLIRQVELGQQPLRGSVQAWVQDSGRVGFIHCAHLGEELCGLGLLTFGKGLQ